LGVQPHQICKSLAESRAARRLRELEVIMPTTLPPDDNNAKRGIGTRHPPIIRELQAVTKPKGRHVEATESGWPGFVAVITNTGLLAVVVFCLIGLLLALNFILLFPDLGAVIEQYNQF
jgi:hypothetical protein